LRSEQLKKKATGKNEIQKILDIFKSYVIMKDIGKNMKHSNSLNSIILQKTNIYPVSVRKSVHIEVVEHYRL